MSGSETSDSGGTAPTKKAAKQAGWLSERDLARPTVRLIPAQGAKGTVIKGEVFYHPDDLEELLSMTEARRRGLGVPVTAGAAKDCYSGHGYYPVYRRSDLRPIGECPEQQARKRARRAALTREKKREARKSMEFHERVAKWLADPIIFPPLAIDELERRAIAHAEQVRERRAARRQAWMEYAEDRGWDVDEWSGPGDYPETVYAHRVSVNYLRHRCSHYDTLLALHYELDAEIEITDEQWRNYVCSLFRAIADSYPHLRAEAERQLQSRGLAGFE